MEFQSDSMHVCPFLCRDELHYTVWKTGRDTNMKCNCKEYWCHHLKTQTMKTLTAVQSCTYDVWIVQVRQSTSITNHHRKQYCSFFSWTRTCSKTVLFNLKGQTIWSHLLPYIMYATWQFITSRTHFPLSTLLHETHLTPSPSQRCILILSSHLCLNLTSGLFP
jgi:hypothetical protein